MIRMVPAVGPLPQKQSGEPSEVSSASTRSAAGGSMAAMDGEMFSREFLQKVLSGSGHPPHQQEQQAGGVTVVDFEVRPGTNRGDNYLSVIYAVRVRARGAGGREETHHLVVKRYPPDPSRKEMLQRSLLFHKEYQVYSILLPYMTDFQKRMGADTLICPATAKCYYGQVGGEDDCVVLGDLRPSGFRMTDKMAGLDLEHCVLVLEELAKFHALSLAMKAEAVAPPLRERFPFLKETIYTAEDPYVERLFHACYLAVVEIVRKDPTRQHLLTSLERFRGKVLETFIWHLNKDGPTAVICHGDYWVNNFLFRYEGAGRGHPVAARFIDLQLVCWAPLVTDLLYLFYTSTTSGFRSRFLERLLGVYHEKLCECLGQLRVASPGLLLSLDQLRKDFRDALPFGFCTAVSCLPLILDDGINLEDVGYAIDNAELEAKMDQMIATSQNNELVRQRVLEMVDEMAEKGVL